MAEESNGQAAVYVSWGTFKNALDSLSEGIPNVIDRTAFPGLSGGVQSQLLAGMKFLGLIDDGGVPTNDLHELAVQDPEKRKNKLRYVLKERYKTLFELKLDSATPQQLVDELAKSYSVTGDTRDKAFRFFVSAGQAAGVPMSRFVVPNENGQPSSRKRKFTRRSKAIAESSEEETDTPPTIPSGTSRTVTLKSGGTFTVHASVDLFKLSPSDRKFVFDVIDTLTAYEDGTLALD